jgi:DNA-binding PadR family transcriptional regulator
MAQSTSDPTRASVPADRLPRLADPVPGHPGRRPARPSRIPVRPRGLIALGALALLEERPMHAYEMQRILHDRRHDFAEGKTRGLYRAIDELESLGWAEPVETSREGRRPERTVYSITPAGREALGDWLFDLLERPIAEYPTFGVAVGLLAHLDQDRALAALQRRAVSLRAHLAASEAGMAAVVEELHLPRIVHLDREHERALVEAELRWVLSIIADIRAGRLAWDEESLRAEFARMQDAEASRHSRRHLDQQGPVEPDRPT